MFRKPNKKELIYLLLIFILYLSALSYVYSHNLSFRAIFKYGLLQPKGIQGEEERLTEIETPLSWSIHRVIWFIYIKGSAVLVELFQYWIVGMFIAAFLVVFIPWQKVKEKMGYGGLGANFCSDHCWCCHSYLLLWNCSCPRRNGGGRNSFRTYNGFSYRCSNA